MLSLKEHQDTLLFSEECWENPDDTDHTLFSTVKKQPATDARPLWLLIPHGPNIL